MRETRLKLPTGKMKEYCPQILRRDFEIPREGCTKRMDDFASTYEVLYDTFEIEEAEQRLALNSHYDALNHKNHEGPWL